MARIRGNYVFGEIDSAISSSDTTLSSPSLASLPAVASPHVAAVTLHDPSSGDFEIVHVTAHTASATTATVVRGREGSTAAAWGSGAAWLHGPTSEDFATHACRVKRVAAHSFSSATMTPIPWDGEWFDTDGYHDNVTNPTRLTVPTGLGGLYVMSGVWVPNAGIQSGARVLVRVLVNGVEVGGSEMEGGGVFPSPTLTLEHPLAAGDYVEWAAYVSVGSPTTNVANTTFSMRLTGSV